MSQTLRQIQDQRVGPNRLFNTTIPPLALLPGDFRLTRSLSACSCVHSVSMVEVRARSGATSFFLSVFWHTEQVGGVEWSLSPLLRHQQSSELAWGPFSRLCQLLPALWPVCAARDVDKWNTSRKNVRLHRKKKVSYTWTCSVGEFACVCVCVCVCARVSGGLYGECVHTQSEAPLLSVQLRC